MMSEIATPFLEPDPADAVGEGVDIDLHVVLLDAHPREALCGTHRTASRDHRLRGDAVEQVGRTSHDLALNHGDLGTEPGGPCGRGIPAGPAADDHESMRHTLRLPSSPRAGRGIRWSWVTPWN